MLYEVITTLYRSVGQVHRGVGHGAVVVGGDGARAQVVLVEPPHGVVVGGVLDACGAHVLDELAVAVLQVS